MKKAKLMNFAWSDTSEGVSWEELCELYRLAPLGDKSPADLETVFGNSRFKQFVFDDGKLIAAGRALSDGLDCSYIADVAVLPGYQGRGIGGELVRRLVQLSRGHNKIILYAVPGAEVFYTTLGFQPMATAMGIFKHEAQAFERGYLIRRNQ
ncbi:GNAT family N-acetyltransferase [Massilia sp. PAMC28688]|uniref:GNAT family N-acetyltransferase n=1 Tax=Massilia sp. PAMC28688 TaxID=2861283 RepID=UPI0027D9861D|nr:GNAT family N-acetyltransferase [Massilia sp. PAMC28688]